MTSPPLFSSPDSEEFTLTGISSVTAKDFRNTHPCIVDLNSEYYLFWGFGLLKELEFLYLFLCQ